MREIVETRARIGQLAADAVGPSLLGMVARTEEILGTSIGLSLAEKISRVALGDSMITANIAALSVGKQVLEWADSIAATRSLTKELSAQFADMKQVADLVEQQNRRLLRLRPSWQIAQPASLSTPRVGGRLTDCDGRSDRCARVAGGGSWSNDGLDLGRQCTAHRP